MSAQKTSACQHCEKIAEIEAVNGSISTETRIDMVFEKFMAMADQELIPELLLITTGDIHEDVYQEIAVAVMEYIFNVPAGVVIKQSELYEAVETYMIKWVKAQVDRDSCRCGFSYAEIVTLCGLEDRNMDDVDRYSASYHKVRIDRDGAIHISVGK